MSTHQRLRRAEAALGTVDGQGIRPRVVAVDERGIVTSGPDAGQSLDALRKANRLCQGVIGVDPAKVLGTAPP